VGGDELLDAARATAALFADQIPETPATGYGVGACHGSAGTALGLSALVASGAARAEDAMRFAAHAAAAGGGPLQGLCCGRFSRVEALAAVGHRLDRPELLSAARQLAASSLARAAAAGGLHVVPGVARPLYAPGLLQGRAGIGLTLLRLSGAGILPSALLLE
jgi:lantibiotic modifying enzyme